MNFKVEEQRRSRRMPEVGELYTHDASGQGLIFMRLDDRYVEDWMFEGIYFPCVQMSGPHKGHIHHTYKYGEIYVLEQTGPCGLQFER
jgi:hypothetical protein